MSHGRDDIGVSHAPVSVVMLTKNEALNIERSLTAVAGWCRDIHVIDSGSTDGTQQIARRFKAYVHEHPYRDHRDQLSWALAEVPIESEWILLIDADHIVTPQLRDDICRVTSGDTAAAGYYVAFEQFFRGKRLRGLKAQNLALFRRSLSRLDSSELVDFRILVQGTTERLRGSLLHYNAKEADIDFWIDKHQKFAVRLAVEETLRQAGILRWSFQPKILGNADERMVFFKNGWYHLPLFVRPFLYFSYRYWVRLGMLDGWNGFVFHFLQAFWFRLMVDIQISDLRRSLKNGERTLDSLQRKYVGELLPHHAIVEAAENSLDNAANPRAENS